MPRPSANGKVSLPVRVWRIVCTSLVRYNEIDGEQRAASFAYYAFFSLFPLIVLLVTTLGGSLLKDQAAASVAVTGMLEQYIPTLSDGDHAAIVRTVDGFIAGRGSAGLVAILTLAWSSIRFFQALVRGVNRAWGTKEYAWWHLPIKNLGMVALLASGMVLGGILPTVLNVVRSYAPQQAWVVPFVNFASSSVSVLILFYVILLFYKYAPRGLVSIRDVTIPAMTVTALLKIVQYLFDIYLKSYANFNIIYGTFAGVIALMLWIYISGSLLIFGGCLCAVSKEMRVAVLKTRPKK